MLLRTAIASGWLLMLLTYSPTERPAGTSQGTLDGFSLAKLAVRGVVLGVLTVLAYRLWADPCRPAAVKRFLPWACFAAWAVASTAWSPLWTVSLGQSASLVVLLFFAFCIALATPRVADVSKVVKHLSLSLAFVCATLVGLRLLHPASESLTRAGHGALHATNAAAAAGLGLLLVACAWLVCGWRWSRWLVAPALAIHVVTLTLAHNRASLAITALVCGGVLLWRASPAWRLSTLAAGGMAAAVYVALDPGFEFVAGMGELLAGYTTRGQSVEQMAALSGRDEMWTVIWQSFLRSPLLGHGYFVCSESGTLYVWYAWGNWTAHNFWLQTLVSTGVVGAALLAWALGSYALGMIRAGSLSQRIPLMALAVLAWQVVWGLTNESFVGPLQPESIVFFGILGIAMGRLARAEHRMHREEPLAGRREARRMERTGIMKHRLRHRIELPPAT